MVDEVVKEKIVKKSVHQRIDDDVQLHDLCTRFGKVSNVTGNMVEVQGITLPIGKNCQIIIDANHSIIAEVVGFTNEHLLIMPFQHTLGIANGMLVTPIQSSGMASVSNDLLGRVVNAIGEPIDGKGAVDYHEFYPLHPSPINPLKRERIRYPLDMGVRAINSLLTICIGQRMGIFAESGIGKSVLLGMMTKYTNADVVVVGLIGERGREVKEFIEEILGEIGMKKSVVVAVPADSSPLLKVNGANYATSIAEYFRDQGKHVLLIIDSLTRYAQALREITLAAGELPSSKGYTPSVFARLSQLIERSGNADNDSSSITSIYTVLLENESLNDPVAEHIRSLIDGHIILSRSLAEAGHYPAIDIERSISRVMHQVVPAEQMQAANIIKRIISAYMNNKDMINIGMYQQGSDKLVDMGIKYWSDISKFLCQGMNEEAAMADSLNQLVHVIEAIKGGV
jgi:flagellum-specific ATP synthase